MKNLSINQNPNEKLTIEYYVYENDKEDKISYKIIKSLKLTNKK